MDLFLCLRFACRLTPAACVARQTARHQTGGAINGKVPTRLQPCAACAQGAEVRAQLEAAGGLEAALVATERLKQRRLRAGAQRKPTKNKATAVGNAPRPPTLEPAAVAALSRCPAMRRHIVPYRHLLAARAAV